MSMTDYSQFLIPDWPAPANVEAVVTLKSGGVSAGNYASFNLATHVGDDIDAVDENRKRLASKLGQENEVCWLNQIHGSRVVEAGLEKLPDADGIYCSAPGTPLAIMVADCVPIILTDQRGSCVAALHAGWRGLAGGIIKEMIDKMPASGKVMAWMGPAIGQCHYEVGEEVRQGLSKYPSAFRQSEKPSHFMLDMWAVARLQLSEAGVIDVFGGGCCTYCEEERFYSYRREAVTGRIAALVWLSR